MLRLPWEKPIWLFLGDSEASIFLGNLDFWKVSKTFFKDSDGPIVLLLRFSIDNDSYYLNFWCRCWTNGVFVIWRVACVFEGARVLSVAICAWERCRGIAFDPRRYSWNVMLLHLRMPLWLLRSFSLGGICVLWLFKLLHQGLRSLALLRSMSRPLLLLDMTSILILSWSFFRSFSFWRCSLLASKESSV